MNMNSFSIISYSILGGNRLIYHCYSVTFVAFFGDRNGL